jgi:hypothetical protein
LGDARFQCGGGRFHVFRIILPFAEVQAYQVSVLSLNTGHLRRIEAIIPSAHSVRRGSGT